MSATVRHRLTIGVAAAVIAVLTAACSVVTPATSANVPATAPAAADQAVAPIVTQLAAAWNGNRPADMAALFTTDATYDDLAFQASWRGTDQIAQWVGLTHSAIDRPDVRIDTAFRSGDRLAVTWTFSGQVRGAPRAFSVPVTTIMQLRDEQILHNSDYYNLSALLRQSGLPADWDPSAG